MLKTGTNEKSVVKIVKWQITLIYKAFTLKQTVERWLGYFYEKAITMTNQLLTVSSVGQRLPQFFVESVELMTIFTLLSVNLIRLPFPLVISGQNGLNCFQSKPNRIGLVSKHRYPVAVYEECRYSVDALSAVS